MLYAKKTAVLLQNALLLVLVLVFGVSLTLTGRMTAGTVMHGRRSDAVALAVTVYHASDLVDRTLDILATTHTPAAFFVSAAAARERPDQIARILAEGHTLGTLGYLPLYDGGPAAMTRDVRLSAAALGGDAGGVKYYLSWLRDASASAKAAKAAGLIHLKGTQDLLTARGSAEDILSRAEQAEGGSILVAQPTQAFVTALPALIYLISEQYTWVSLDAILEEPYAEKDT